MSNETPRIRRTLKFLKWTKKYSGWWLLICGHRREHMNLKMMQMLIKRLADEGFYEIIFVLIEVYRDEDFVKSVKEILLKDLLISEWKNGGKDELIQKLLLLFNFSSTYNYFSQRKRHANASIA